MSIEATKINSGTNIFGQFIDNSGPLPAAVTNPAFEGAQNILAVPRLANPATRFSNDIALWMPVTQLRFAADDSMGFKNSAGFGPTAEASWPFYAAVRSLAAGCLLTLSFLVYLNSYN